MNDLTPLKLKYVADFVQRGDAPTYVDADGITVINQACVWPSGIDLSKKKFHDPDDVSRITAWLKPNDVLINSTGTGTLGRVAHVQDDPASPMFADGHVTIIRDSSQRFEPRYLFYVLSVQQEQITVECSDGATNQIELSRHKLGNKYIEWPPIDVQRQVVAYLDRHTNHIDKLITEKQSLLDLLVEKRRAVIADCAARGLNASALLRDSGIPWLSEIPAHWDTVRARFLFAESNLPVRPDDQMVTCFRDGEVTLRSNRRDEGFTNAVLELGYQGIRSGQLVLHSMDAFAGAIGVSDSDGKCSPEYVICDPMTDRTDSYYYGLLLREMALRNFIQASCPAVRERAPRIRFNDFKDFLLPVPPLPEQREIVAKAAEYLAPINALHAEATSTVALLQERCSALISAAVTGQIDIREATA